VGAILAVKSGNKYLTASLARSRVDFNLMFRAWFHKGQGLTMWHFAKISRSYVRLTRTEEAELLTKMDKEHFGVNR
jgi:hypothetical protein